MPRPRGVKKTISEKITEKEQNILDLTERLAKEKLELQQLKSALKEKQMNQLLQLMNQNNLDINTIELIIQNYISGQDNNEQKEIIEKTA